MLTPEQLHLLNCCSINEIYDLAQNKRRAEEQIKKNAAYEIMKMRGRICEVNMIIIDLKTRRISKRYKTKMLKTRRKQIIKFEAEIEKWLKIKHQTTKQEDAIKVVEYIEEESRKINLWRRREAEKRKQAAMNNENVVSKYIGSGTRKEKHYDDRENYHEIGERNLLKKLQRYKVTAEVVL